MDLARSCGPLGSGLAGAESFGEAAEAFAEGLRTVLPYAERHPRALAELAVHLMRSYAATAEKAGQEPDLELVAGAMRILGPHL